ncbi:MAG: glycosyltransferase family 4 protein [Bacteroidales bacterium]
MRFAFYLFKYFPYGGLQRGFLHLAQECLSRGHQVEVYTGSWSGNRPDHLKITCIQLKGITNHSRYVYFAQQVEQFALSRQYDAIVGFNKMPGLDVYFASDVCYASLAKERSFLYRLTPRCRTLLSLEKAVFDPQSSTQIISISDQEMKRYISCYGTPVHRFHSVPPGISKSRLDQANIPETRMEVRRELNISMESYVVVMVGSDYKRKGVDRAIYGMNSLPQRLKANTELLIIGEGRVKPYIRLAKRLKISPHIHFLGKREDVPRLLAGADLLLHPAYHENTGTVLIEALGAGLPVLATDVCGYASHVELAKAGQIIPSPFQQQNLNIMLMNMLESPSRAYWSENGKNYVKNTDVCGRHIKSADVIESIVKNKKQ